MDKYIIESEILDRLHDEIKCDKNVRPYKLFLENAINTASDDRDFCNQYNRHIESKNKLLKVRLVDGCFCYYLNYEEKYAEAKAKYLKQIENSPLYEAYFIKFKYLKMKYNC